jgi:hypothetical protein
LLASETPNRVSDTRPQGMFVIVNSNDPARNKVIADQTKISKRVAVLVTSVDVYETK